MQWSRIAARFVRYCRMTVRAQPIIQVEGFINLGYIISTVANSNNRSKEYATPKWLATKNKKQKVRRY